MSDLQMWELIVGFISATFVLPVIQQPKWNQRGRSVITFAYCTAAGLITAWLNGAFDGVQDIRTGVSSVLFMLVTAVASYKGFAKPSGVAPAIEAATSPPPSAP